jgi:hypothetical protein
VGQKIPCAQISDERFRGRKVIAFYSKGGGKNGKHAAIPNVSNVAGISYVGVQVFQRMHRQIFRPVTSSTISFGTMHYQLLPSKSLLCRLSSSPQVKNDSIEIHADDLRIFDTLDNNVKTIEAAVKLFSKRGKGKVAEAISEDEE